MNPEALTADSTLAEVTELLPGAQRTLFRKYHIGGCSSCAFQLNETLAQLCARNGNLNPAEVLQHLRDSHREDEALLISPHELALWRQRDAGLRIVDVRSREEFEAVHMEGSLLLSQTVMREILADGTNDRPLVILDHQGRQSLDAAAYFLGHGLKNVRCLRGGLDAWSREVDPSVRRYTLEKDDASAVSATARQNAAGPINEGAERNRRAAA